MRRREIAQAGSLFSILALVVGSSCDPSYTDCAIQCAQNGACPSGFECSNGFCTDGATCEALGNSKTNVGGRGEPFGGTGSGGRNSSGGGGPSAGGFGGDAGSGSSTGGGPIAGTGADGGMGGETSRGGSNSTGGTESGGGYGGIADPGGSGGDAGGDAGSGGAPWSPADLPGLVLWLDAAVGVETMGLASNLKVNEWRDQSGQSNHARQPIGESQPRLSTGAVNGNPAVEFSGPPVYLRISDSESLQAGYGDATLLIVAAWTNSIIQIPDPPYYGYGVLFAKLELEEHSGIALLANDGWTHQSNLLSQIKLFDWLGSSASGLNDGNYRLLGFRRFGTDLRNGVIEVRVNRSSDRRALSEPYDLSASGTPIYLGGSGFTYDTLNGAIAEIVFVRGTLPNQTFAELERYLNEKYALF